MSRDEITLLFERYSGMVYRRCKALLKDEDAACDAVQEVFMRAIAHYDDFRADSEVMTWLYRIATTYCLQQLRNHKRRREKLRAHGPILPSVKPRSIEQWLIATEMLEIADPKLQQALFHRYVEGMTMEETAELVGWTRKTVAKKLNAFFKRTRGPLET